MMLAPAADGAPLRPADRQIQLLRRIGRSLGPDELIGTGRGIDLGQAPSPDHCLAWALDLLGYRLDPVARSALLHDTGGRPQDLRAVLDALLDHGREAPAGPGMRRLGLAELKQVRQDPTVRERRLQRVLTSLRDHPMATALLFTAVWLDGVATRDHLLGEFGEGLAVLLGVDPDEHAGGELLPGPDDVADAARILVGIALFELGDEPAAFRLTGSGIREVLAAAPNIEERVVSAVIEVRRRAEQPETR
jgi:hypothetical protein